MQTAWRYKLTDSEWVRFKELLLGSTIVLDKAREILYNRVYNGEVVKTADYDSGSWAYKQADRNGYLRAYREIIEFLDVSDHETKTKDT